MIEDTTPLCRICGEPATHAFAGNPNLLACSVVCDEAVIQFINEALATKVQGVP
jgi:hypothetical protein